MSILDYINIIIDVDDINFSEEQDDVDNIIKMVKSELKDLNK